MRIKFNVNTDDLKLFAIALREGIDMSKVLDSYVKGLRNLAHKKHSRPYGYRTPTIGMAAQSGGATGVTPGGRTNLRKRTGRLSSALKNSYYARKQSNVKYEVGYNLNTLYSIAPHARQHINKNISGEITEKTYYPRRKYFYIPLKAAQNPDGTLKIKEPVMSAYREGFLDRESDSNWGKKIFTFKTTNKRDYGTETIKYIKASYTDIKNTVDFSGEDTSKFHDYSQILYNPRDNKPYFVLAKKIKIPNRLTLAKDLNDAVNSPKGYNTLNTKIEQAIAAHMNKLRRARR
jgi:hypothetical protein